MQNQLENFTIDGKSYEFYMMPPSKALKIFMQLVRRSLSPAGAAIDSGDFSLSELMKQKINLSGMLSRLSENFDEDWAQQVIMQLLEHVRHQGGKPIVFEVEFVGKIFHLFKIVGKAFEVNYRDFIQGLSGVLSTANVSEQAKK